VDTLEVIGLNNNAPPLYSARENWPTIFLANLHLKCIIAQKRLIMKQRFIPRSLEPVLKRASHEFPAVVLTGPRQSGKTTLLKELFKDSHRYVSLELPDIRAAATNDPRGFLELNSPPVIFDEVQYCPNLLPYIKEHIDAHRSKHGQFLLTGSQNLLLLERVTESLAGRAAMLNLLPLSFREMQGRATTPFPWEKSGPPSIPKGLSLPELWGSLLRGGYPELAADRDRDLALWHSSYIQTYLERDVRSLRQVGDLTLFQSFLRAIAARSGQLLNMAELARDLGVAVNTGKAWLSVLEASFQVIVLRPYFANVGKRLVKTPKVYFADTGTLCHLAGLRGPQHAASGPMGGQIFETAVLAEIVKTFRNRGDDPKLYFWRTSSGVEVDIIIDIGIKLIPIEVKLSATPKPSMADGILSFRKDFGKKSHRGYVIHPGDILLPLGENVTALPFCAL
jgi:predicted AAA+ superfamily ATPase